MLRYETLGRVSKKQASQTLAAKVAAADDKRTARSHVSFRTLTGEWLATVVPMYKQSTQKNHRHIVAKHLLPRFGEYALADLTQQAVQAYVADLVTRGYAPKTVDHSTMC